MSFKSVKSRAKSRAKTRLKALSEVVKSQADGDMRRFNSAGSSSDAGEGRVDSTNSLPEVAEARADSTNSLSDTGEVRVEPADDFQLRQEALQDQILEQRAKRAERARRRAADRARAFGDLCEASEGMAVVWRRESWYSTILFGAATDDAVFFNCCLRLARREATRRINRLRHGERRPFYYEREKERRQALAAERRKVAQRTTDNPCPTPEQLLDAWEAAQESPEGVLRFGSLLEDLACYVDSGLMRTEEGEIYGRRGGIKAWLRENLPALFLKYKTVMAYKVAARKAKQLTGLADPTPAARLVEEPRRDEPVEFVRAKAVYREIVGEPKSRTAWLNRIEAFANPGRVTEATTLEAWKQKYKDEITVRTKSSWVARLRRGWGTYGRAKDGEAVG